MMSFIEFQTKIRNMSSQELLMAVVKGLENEWRPYESYDWLFYADTNVICEILQSKIPAGYSQWSGVLQNHSFEERAFICNVESAFNLLISHGDVENANKILRKINCSEIIPYGKPLPCLTKDNYKENLLPYRKLAEAQPYLQKLKEIYNQ